MGPAGGSVRPALKGNAADKYKALIISAEKGKARKEAVERQRSFAAALDDEAVRSECPTPLSHALPSPDTMTKVDTIHFFPPFIRLFVLHLFLFSLNLLPHRCQ